ncbi:MAG: hypothetical protein QM645_08475 [Asticcacaulis sp.]
MLRSLIISLCAFFCLHTVAVAEITAADKKQIDQKVSTFFTHFNSGDLEVMYKDVFMPAIHDNPNLLKNLINQTKSIYEYYQSPIKWSLVEENTEGSVLVYRNYIMHNDRGASRIRFVYQKMSQGWYLHSLLFSDITVVDAED